MHALLEHWLCTCADVGATHSAAAAAKGLKEETADAACGDNAHKSPRRTLSATSIWAVQSHVGNLPAAGAGRRDHQGGGDDAHHHGNAGAPDDQNVAHSTADVVAQRQPSGQASNTVTHATSGAPALPQQSSVEVCLPQVGAMRNTMHAFSHMRAKVRRAHWIFGACEQHAHCHRSRLAGTSIDCRKERLINRVHPLRDLAPVLAYARTCMFRPHAMLLRWRCVGGCADERLRVCRRWYRRRCVHVAVVGHDTHAAKCATRYHTGTVCWNVNGTCTARSCSHTRMHARAFVPWHWLQTQHYFSMCTIAHGCARRACLCNTCSCSNAAASWYQGLDVLHVPHFYICVHAVVHDLPLTGMHVHV